ncbi:MAG: hypothetical protein LBR43_01090 [Spiroplasmataceae bacterium]|nr:hypothetical protein [Spiroplasmataceae bacterium]
MVNAQEYLDKEYPLEERNKITDLNINDKKLEGKLKLDNFLELKKFNCGWNELTDLDLSDCKELTYIECQGNLLTKTDFLSTLSNPQKLTFLYMGENNFAKQNLSFIQPFTNLETLRIWNSHQKRIDGGLINRFYGSLKYLKDMKNLKQFGISNTDVDSGLEYLAGSKLEIFPSYWYPWGDNSAFSGKINGAKSERIFAELLPYTIDLKKGKYNFSAWNSAKLFSLITEKQDLEKNKQLEITTIGEFEKLPFVCQVETLVYVNWLGETGIKSPYSYQTIEEALKQQALRVWNEKTYDENEILKMLTENNARKGDIKHVLERILLYKNTSSFGEDMNARYRWNAIGIMNSVYQKQLEINQENKKIYQGNLAKLNEELEEISNELLEIKKSELSQLIKDAKSKLEENLHDYLDILLESPDKSSISDRAKRNLTDKINGNELQKLILLQHQINHLEKKISESSQQVAQIEVLPPSYN